MECVGGTAPNPAILFENWGDHSSGPGGDSGEDFRSLGDKESEQVAGVVTSMLSGVPFPIIIHDQVLTVLVATSDTSQVLRAPMERAPQASVAVRLHSIKNLSRFGRGGPGAETPRILQSGGGWGGRQPSNWGSGGETIVCRRRTAMHARL